jgi:uncharacterized damage-inducible protein DinB
MAEEQNTTNLDSPGAGLPTIERMVARIGLAAYAAMKTKEQVLQRFQEEAENAILLVEPLGEDVAKTRVLIPRPRGIEDSSRNWSAAMVLEHLVIVNLGIAAIISALCDADAGGELPEVRIEAVKPSEDAGLEQIERLRKAVEIYARAVSRAGSLQTQALHPHPWFGPLDGRKWHALAAIHNGLHRRQIEAIVQRLG